MVGEEGFNIERGFTFGPFRLFVEERLIEKEGAPLRIGGRALDILILLVERAGEVVSKRDLIDRVWPDVTVDEGSLRFHVAALRKALADGDKGIRYVTNVPGRGYCFVAPVLRPGVPRRSAAEALPARQPNSLPARLPRMVGRDRTVGMLSEQLVAHRFVTVVGPGGIGKTTVAVSVAHALFAAFDDGIRFVDLGTLSEPRLVAGTVATSVGLSVNSEDPAPGLVSFLRDKHMLLVLDSCEHVIDAAAALSESIFLRTPRVHILATSREALRVEGKTIHRLFPLDYPPDDAALTAAEALRFPAVQLFAERVAASANYTGLSDHDARIAAEICRKLDGIALAVELAAGRVAAYGIRGTAALLEDRFGILTRGRRTAPARHQTLHATFDWSYHLLHEYERLTLRRLSIFVGPFTLDAARSIATGHGLDEAEIVEAIGNLIDKSLLTSGKGAVTEHHRLLDTTRAYAMEKLIESGELAAVAHRHAVFYRAYLEPAEVERTFKPVAEWLATYGTCLENVRAALNWSFSPDGDAATGVALVVAAIPLWFELSLVEECRRRTEQALATPRDESRDGRRREMKLLAALGGALQGPGPGLISTWENLLELAERLDDIDYQLRALWGLWIASIMCLEWRKALVFARRFCVLAENSADPADMPIGDRILGSSLHWRGDQPTARFHIERMLATDSAAARRSQTIRFQFDQPLAARAMHARILWIQGSPDAAILAARSCVEDARSLGHSLSLCHTIAHAAAPICLFVGDLTSAERYVTMLLEHSTHEGLRVWNTGGRAYRATLLINRGDLTAGLPSLRRTLDDLQSAKLNMYNAALLGTLAEGYGRAGTPDIGLAAADEALTQCEATDEGWCVPELLRIKGELLVQQGLIKEALRCFEIALDTASLQGALWWELRASTSLAMLWRDQGRGQEALDLLRKVYSRFAQGFETAHLQSARMLIDSLMGRS